MGAIAKQAKKTTGERAVERTDLRRKQIFDAAAGLFTEKGFHSTTVQDVAREAGLGKGTIYEYVRSKKELLFLVVEEGQKMYMDVLEKAAARGRTPEQRVRAMIHDTLAFFEEHRQGMRTIMPELEGTPQEELAHLVESHKNILSIFREVLDEGVKDGSFRRMDTLVVSALVMTCCMEWDKLEQFTAGWHDLSIKKYENLLYGMFFDGIIEK